MIINIQKISQKYYISEIHVLIDEQLIFFKKRSKHTLKMIAEIIDKNFKIYNLYEINHLLTFSFFSSK